MFFASRICFKHFSRLQKKQCSLKSRKCLKQLRETKWHETIVEGQRLRKADIMEKTSFFHDKMSKKEWRRHVHVHLFVHVDVRHERETKRVRRELGHNTPHTRGSWLLLPFTRTCFEPLWHSEQTWLLLPCIRVCWKNFTTLTFGAQRRSRLVSTQFDTIAKRKRDKEARRPRVNSSLQ